MGIASFLILAVSQSPNHAARPHGHRLNAEILDRNNGPLGAVVAVMLWFFVTAYAVLLGAELNAQIERGTSDTSSSDPALLPQAV